MTEREQLIELSNKLFIYTDYKEWQKLKEEVFVEGDIFIDMTSTGAGTAAKMTVDMVCSLWNVGFEGIDAVHHQSGNFLVTLNNNEAAIYCYAIASHYKAAATEGKTREFVGSYNIGCEKTAAGWRINSFKYNLKYINGNIDFK
ncbi:nuclear transport factor 2 family protein [Solitalea canadensis]|uniref:SnoaL-like domain-containing protein n=1 Tax=Solitalea canadensis (strain ATCC 29591 / DSM 3403 / JCM 21819 / LMG 8368 / NBRC 15130 / NCIMB 12057 / USAM 9D) TaxID=929556 RepID=H8KSX5_SOLCM|nr:nuclear transport factor 2 family protein [Solitalea canadensis]AFD05435.1 hypothetical protein Solca_0291 [Solitalea canadensis DSM 3403]